MQFMALDHLAAYVDQRANQPEAPVEHSRALTASHPERPAVASIVGSDTMLRLADIAW